MVVLLIVLYYCTAVLLLHCCIAVHGVWVGGWILPDGRGGTGLWVMGG